MRSIVRSAADASNKELFIPSYSTDSLGPHSEYPHQPAVQGGSDSHEGRVGAGLWRRVNQMDLPCGVGWLPQVWASAVRRRGPTVRSE
ncbi:hypothetical protein GCM10010306_062840 [Streptomyces umbrinus]|nr:hypothetical protein GCM10010306_062840 [Streptomyces umbrinus]